MNARRWLARMSALRPLALGALAVPVASLGIAAVISALYWLAYFVHLGAPPTETLELVAAATLVLQHSGALMAGLSLLLLSRLAAARHWVALTWQRSVLPLALGTWCAGLPFALHYSDSLARYAWVLALHMLAASLGVRWGGRERRLTSRLLETMRQLRRAKSPEALVRAIAAFDGSGDARVALFEAESGSLTRATPLRPLAASWEENGHLAEFVLNEAPPLLGLLTRSRVRLDRTTGSRVVRAKLYGPSFWFALINEGGPTGVLLISFESGRPTGRGTLQIYQSFAEQAAAVWRQQCLLRDAEAAARQRERLRVSYELHDTLTQDLVSGLMYLRSAQSSSESASGDADRARERARLCEAERIVQQALEEARRLTWACYEAAATPVRPTAFGTECERQLQAFSRQTALEATFRAEGSLGELGPRAREVLLAALREALSNVKKHSGAERVRVTLSRIDEWVALDVCDDGTGGGVSTDAELPPAGFGLTSLRRRVEEIGGRLVLEFTAQAGSTLSVQLPERGRM